MCISTHISCKIHTSDTIVGESDTNEGDENIDQNVYTEKESGEEDVNYRTELKRLEDLGECRKSLLQSKSDDQILHQLVIILLTFDKYHHWIVRDSNINLTVGD